MYSDTDFTEEERAMLKALETQGNEEATPNEEAPGQVTEANQTQAAEQDASAGKAEEAATAAQEAAKDQAPSQEQAQTTESTAEGQTAKKAGDLRNALRASRRGERAAREEAERLRKEVEDLKAGKGKAEESAELTEDELMDLETDFPVQAAAIRKLNATVQELKRTQRVEPPTPKEEEFVPPALVPELQDVVDDIPELLDMQNDPDQTRWQLAVEADRLLSSSPKWANKPLAERLAEAARLAGEHAGAEVVTPPKQQQTPPAQNKASRLEEARKRIEQVAETTPTSISDIRGGASPNGKITPNYHQMSDDAIIASLG